MNQEKAIELALKGHNIFLTGQAGTGKTYTLNKIIDKLEEKGKKVARTASTGVASTYLDGITIHSWSGVGIKKSLTLDDKYKIKNNKFSRNKIYFSDVLVIDEISMLHDYFFDLVEEMCSFVKSPGDVFGKLQVIVCGDFFQLPPVNPGTKEKKYCFHSKAWEALNFKVCYLDKIYRQKEKDGIIEILNAIRSDNIQKDHIDVLNSLSLNLKYKEKAINLYCKNVNVDIENRLMLDSLDGDFSIFRSESGGNEYKIKTLQKNIPVEDSLLLKKGAKAMLVINNFKKDFVNGTICKIIEFDEENEIILVETQDKREIEIEKNKWEIKEFDERTQKNSSVAFIKQYPLRLAWSLTVHKAQGASFDYVNLDLKDTFIENLGYVALSRVTSLDGLYLSGFNEKSLEIDPIIIKKDKEFIQKSKENE